MSDTHLDPLFENLSLTWETAMKEKRPRDVIDSGLLAYHFFRDKGDFACEHASLLIVRTAIDDILANAFPNQKKDQSQPACSFCGRSEPQVRLVAGAHGFICDSCVSLVSDVFKETQPSPT
jgi:hypothetical protein